MVVIGGHDYKVIYDTDIVICDAAQGQHIPNGTEIKIYPFLKNKDLTLYHEIMEAVNYTYCAGELDHRHIEQIAQALFQILPQLGVSIEWNQWTGEKSQSACQFAPRPVLSSVS